MDRSVRQAVASMHKRYCDPLTLNEIAAEVFVSPYHFSRVFSRAVGVTPGKYLTSVRLFAAKRLLLTTALTVSDIVCSVGYNSVGTFTSRFTRAVGMSPTQYRDPKVAELLVVASHEYSCLPPAEEMRRARRLRTRPEGPSHSISGAIDLPDEAGQTDVLVAVFPEAIPQGAPVAYEVLSAKGRAEFTVADVPTGPHVVIALAVPKGDRARSGRMFMGSSRHPVNIARGLRTYVHLSLSEVQETDAPIAVTLAEPTVSVESRFSRSACIRQTVA
ncbi:MULTISPECIES: helix-turn-helix transcriptional regulator [unclassified Nocardiopsis]|uniref:helix-turn-helix transcriptional regulator n=1 Tax=unclassified Nocardiopsis TaxID=2649073 RepID=UPI00093E71D2|nr:helix-turn-helix transcriptional regulator [Nocardiopsis sp. TSRI0078]